MIKRDFDAKSLQMKQHHFRRSKMADLMTFDEYTEFNDLFLKKQPVPNYAKVPLAKSNVGKATSMTNLLTKLIVEHAELHGHMLKRLNSTGIPVHDARGKLMYWKMSANKRGTVLDIEGRIHGEHVEIEVKFGNDKLSPEQRKHIERVRANGGVVAVVKTLTEYIDKIGWMYDVEKFKEWKRNQLNTLF